MFTADDTILVVDDEPAIAEILSDLLELSQPAKIVSRGDARSALEFLDNNEVSLLITDHSMPDVTGMELIPDVLSHPNYKRAYAVLLSGYVAAEFVDQDKSLLNDILFVNKPVDINELLQSIEEHEKRSSPATIPDQAA